MKEYDPRTGAGGVKRTEYALDGLDPVVEYRRWDGQRDEFYRGGLESFSPTPMLLAMRHFPAGAEGQAYWYHLDGRGSVAGLTKHQGQSTHNYRYDAYGQVLPAQGNFTNPHNHYTFIGKEWDEHLELYEFGVRLYDPWAGVWLTREPLPGQAWAPRTWHRYQYAYASPISYYDPYGLQVPPPECEPGEICYTGTFGPYTNVSLVQPAVPLPKGAISPLCLTPPPITVFVWQMMQEAVRSRAANWIRYLNQTCYRCAWERTPFWWPGVAEAYQVAAQADAIAHLEAYALWAWMVRQGGPWDPKWQIINTYGGPGYWVKLGDEYEYYYDVWGNVLYGYLGKAIGFSEEELFHGAGLEQIGSDVGYAFKYGDLTRLPRPRINVEGLAAFDHPQDRTGIEIGITLWEQYRTNFTPEDLERAIIRRGEWLERRLPLSP